MRLAQISDLEAAAINAGGPGSGRHPGSSLAVDHPLHKLAVSNGYGLQKTTHHPEGDTTHEYLHPGHGHTITLTSEPKGDKTQFGFMHQTFSKHSGEPLTENGTTAKELSDRIKRTHT